MNQASLFDYLAPAPAIETKVKNAALSPVAQAIACLQLLKKDETTQDEIEIIDNFNGFGEISEAFNQDHKDYDLLRSCFVSDKAFQTARASTPTSFYTPKFIIDSMYRCLVRLGFNEGNIIEPSCGTGRFIKSLPDTINAKVTAVELDETSGRLARLLNPKAKILINQRFENVKLDKNFSLAITNVPFSSNKAMTKELLDTSNLHSYFIAKALHSVHNGGFVAVVVSTWLLDSISNKNRKAIFKAGGELVAGARLPNNVFKGTSTSADVLIFQKVEKPMNRAWLDVADYPDMTINPWIATRVLGELHPPKSKYDRASCNVHFTKDDSLLPKHLNSLLDSQSQAPIFHNRTAASFKNVNRVNSYSISETCLSRSELGVINNQLVQRLDDAVDTDGSHIHIITNVDCKGKKKDRLIAYVAVKDALKNLIAAEQQDADTIDSWRHNLNATYDAFVCQFGRLTSTTNRRALAICSHFFRIRALETTNNGKISKAIIFTQRVFQQKMQTITTSDLHLAVKESLNKTGYVSINLVSQLMKKPNGEIKQSLVASKLAFPNPATNSDNWLFGPMYLSGDIRQKLADCRMSPYNTSANQKALNEILPSPIKWYEISASLSASWIKLAYKEAFIKHLIDRDVEIIYTDQKYYIEKNINYIMRSLACDLLGTERMPFGKLIEKVMNSAPVVVKDEIDGKRFINHKETLLAIEKAELIKQKWQEWLFLSVTRRAEIEDKYNALFNSHVSPTFNDTQLIDNAGIDCSKDLYPSQRRAVTRAILSKSLLLDHAVGAGKTLTYGAIASKLKQFNHAERSMLVAPNELVEQLGEEISTDFPLANLLIITPAMLNSQNRVETLYKIAISDFTLCIVPLSAIKSIPLSREENIKLINTKIDALEQSITKLTDKHSVKALEKRLEGYRVKLHAITNDKEIGFSWDDLKISTLMIDEIQSLKNLEYNTSMRNVAGLNPPAGSKIAFDVYSKARQVLNNGGRLIGGTGTTVLNSIVEINTWLRLFSPELEQKLGLQSLDQFCALFASPTTDFEYAASGNGLKPVTRLRNYTNLPELSALYRSFADVVTTEDLERFIPKLPDGRPSRPPLRDKKQTNVIIEPNIYQELAFEDIVEKSKNLTKEQNMLYLINLGRNASLDIRTLNANLPDVGNNKINFSVQNILAKYAEYDHVKGTQLVFIDRSIPLRHRKSSANRLSLLEAQSTLTDAELEEKETLQNQLNSQFSVYDCLTEQLVYAGIPSDQIAVVHDFKTPSEQLDLKEKINAGLIRVLLGSTAKMGAGKNYNKRLTALHHLDLPLRNGDLEQRNGRILRAGNELWANDPEFSVEIFTYLTARSLDTWQLGLLEQKGKFISAFKNGKTGRTFDDKDTSSLSYAELAALTSGNHELLELMKFEKQLSELSVIRSQFYKDKQQRESRLIECKSKLKRLATKINRHSQDINNIDVKSGLKDLQGNELSIDDLDYVLRGLYNSVAFYDGEKHSAFRFNGYETAVRYNMGVTEFYITSNNEYFVCKNLKRAEKVINAVSDTISRFTELNTVWLHQQSQLEKEIGFLEASLNETFTKEKEFNNLSIKVSQLKIKVSEKLDLKAA
ncbi:hypothetical protein VAS14_00096 [Vibrio angustum S14]|uniref:Helicase ATP-binding domain-containing protein n=1 Tax=Photobacterium angustum (strain S14 / CCUG 15956) TaxID=314292 RepID=Q1ZJV0_PHOAS|nr:N-6 DNA methylase [Photobacterium angustum]EAS62422.1 hypothetical protein VAS14_00096 [Vibrio angustum S14] [Photobacterium angustum S14]